MTPRWATPTVIAGDDGSATLWALALVLVLWVSVAGVLLAGIAITARHRAATAADLAALAAAAALPAGPACTRANRIAVANGATISSCQVSGAAVEVTATVTVDALRYLGVGAVSARARAGPG